MNCNACCICNLPFRLFLGFLLIQTDCLVLQVRNEELFIHDRGILQCYIHGMNSTETHVEDLMVQWKVTSSGGDKVLYTFKSGKHDAKRDGAKITEGELRKGNASLSLPNVQVDDEGDYHCIVWFNTSKSEEKLKVHVSARPQINLTPKEVHLLVGNEKSLDCTVHGYYPKKIGITWKRIKDGVETAVMGDVCTGAPTSNDDGTYNRRSRLRLLPSIDDNGTVYTCEVIHKTFFKPAVTESTLFVEEPRDMLLDLLLVVTGIGAAVIVVLGLHWHFRFNGGSPPVIDIVTPDQLKHKEKTRLSCQISGLRSKCIKLFLKLKRRKHDFINIFEWENKSAIVTRKCDNTDETIIPLNSGMGSCDPESSFKVKITSTNCYSDGTYSIACEISVLPDYYTDHDSELLVELHDGQQNPVRKSKKICVSGVKPRMSGIIMPPVVNHNEVVALTCPIIGFKPRLATITWYKIDRDGQKREIVKVDAENKQTVEADTGKRAKYSHSLGEMQADDATNDVMSVLIFLPTLKEDDDSTYICKVYHEATKYTLERKAILQVKAAPKLDFVQLSPDVPVANSPLTLSCKIHSYFPKDNLEVFWYYDGKLMEEGTNVGAVSTTKDNLHYCTSAFNFTPTWKDVGKKFTCEVKHGGLLQPKRMHWTLEELVLVPTVTEILSDPPLPELGKPVTLHCLLKNYYPKDCTVAWIRGFERIDDREEISEPVFNKDTKLYSREVHKTFIPTIDDNETEFTVEIVQSGVTHRPPNNGYTMLLKAQSPTVSEISTISLMHQKSVKQ